MKHLIAVTLVFLGTLLSVKAQNSRNASDLAPPEAAFNQALLRGDWKAVEQIEADDLIFTNADGSVTHKSDDVATLRSGTLKFESIDMSELHVQDFGNIAVVTGRLLEKGRYKEEDFRATYRFTNVWAKRDGRWQLVAGQETQVSSPK